MMNKKVRAFVNRLTGSKLVGKPANKGFSEIRNQKNGRAFTQFSKCFGASVCISTLVTPTSLFALPQEGIVKAGSASMVYSSSRLDVNQATDKAVIDWRSFNIAAGEHTRFNQPSVASMTLNRVTTGNPSSILGTLTANGKILLVNPNGVFFGPGSRVDVGGLVATTADIANEDFMAGNLRFAIPSPLPDAAVINQGTITVHDAGLAALVAPVVANSGIIQARLGKVALASGNTFTLDLYGDNLVQFAIGSTVGEDQALAAESLVSNSGLISADGGTVLLTASAAGRAVSKVVNMDGIIEARAVEVGKGGEIILHGGDSGIVSVSGTLDVSGNEAGQQGGSVKVLGDKVGLFAGAVIDASGDAGGGEVLVGGDFQGANPGIKNASATYVDAAASITADGVTEGDGGKVIVWADCTTRFDGDISARGGSVCGDGGFVEVSGKEELSFNGHVSLGAPKGTAGNLLLDPDDIIVAVSGTDDLIGDINNDNNNSLYAFTEDAGEGTKTIAPGTLTSIMYDGTTVTLQAHNDITVNDAIDASESKYEGGGLMLQAGDDVFLNAGIATKNGAVEISAGDILATPTAKDDLGEIVMANGVAITSGRADITMSAEGDVSYDSLETTGNISITSTNGAILDIGTGVDNQIIGGTIHLTAFESIGGSGIGDIDVDTTKLTAEFGGSIYLYNNGDFSSLTLISTQSGDDNVYQIASTNLTFDVTDAGTHYLMTDVSDTSGLDFSFQGDQDIEIASINLGTGNVTLTSTAGSITDSANARISVGSQGILNAGGSITLGDTGTDTVNFGSLNATAATSVIITEDSDMALDGLTAANAFLTSTGSITDNPYAVIAVSGEETLNSGWFITLGDTATDSVNFGSLDATAATSVIITEDSDMVLNTVSGEIIYLVSNSSIYDADTSDDSIPNISGNQINLHAAGSIGAAGAGGGIDINTVDLTAEFDTNIYIKNISDFDSLSLISTQAGDANEYQIAAYDDPATPYQDFTFTVTDDGDHYLMTEVRDTTGLDFFFQGDEAIEIGTIDVGEGTVTLSGDAINDVTLDSDKDITASSVILSASHGIGNNAAIDLVTQWVQGDTTNGAVDINNSSVSSTTVHSLTTGTGSITFDQSGGGELQVEAASTTDGSIAISVEDANLDNSGGTITAGGAGDITLATTATSGSVIVGSINAVENSVIIRSAGAIDDDGSGISDIDAATVDFNAINGIGSTATINLANTASLTADTGSGSIGLTNNATTAVTVSSLNTSSGSISYEQSGNQSALLSAVETTNGDISITNNGGSGADLIVGSVSADLINDTITLTAAGSITDATAGGDVMVDVSSAFINMTASAGGIGQGANGSLDVNATTSLSADTTGDNGNITLVDVNGNLPVGLIDAGTGSVDLTADTINDATADNTTDIFASSIHLNGTSGIGNTAGLELSTQLLWADTANGAIALSNLSGSLATVHSLTTGTGSITFDQTGGGDASIELVESITDGSIDIRVASANLDNSSGTISAGGAGDITLTTTNSGSVILGSVDAAGNLVTISSAGAIEDGDTSDDSIPNISGNQINLHAAGSIGAAGAGGGIDINTVDLTAEFDTNIYIKNISDFDSLSLISTQAGDANEYQIAAYDDPATPYQDFTFTVTDDGDHYLMTEVRDTTGLDFFFQGDEAIEIGTIDVGEGTVTLSGDAINDVTLDSDKDITASSVILSASHGIGNNAAIDLVTQWVQGDTTNGAVDINNSSVSSTTVHSLTTGTGSITFDQSGGGELQVEAASTTDGSIAISVEDANLDNSGGTITAGGAGDITLATTATSGSVIVGSINAVENSVIIRSAGAIDDDGSGISDIDAATVDFNAINGIGSTATINLANTASLTADTGSGSIGLTNNATTAVTVSSLNTSSGSISYEQSGNQSALLSAVETTNGDISITNNGGSGADLIVGSVSADLINDTITLTAAGSITDATAGGDVMVDVSSAFINMTASAGGIGQGANGSLDVNATTSLSADTTGDNGNITLVDVNGNLPVGLIDAGTGSVDLTADTINDATADNTTDIFASSIHLNGTSGIGNTAGLELSTQLLWADTANGAIALSNLSGSLATVHSLTTGTGSITFDQTGGGDASIELVESITDGSIDIRVASANLDNSSGTISAGGAGDITLTTTNSGSVILGSVDAAGQVTISSDGAINDDGLGGTDLAAARANLDAESGIGATSALDTAVIELWAESTHGAIDINNSSAADTTVYLLKTGTGSIDYSQTGGQSVSLVSVASSNGNIILSNTGGPGANMRLGAIAADTTDDSVFMTADGSIYDALEDESPNIIAAHYQIFKAVNVGGTGAADIDTSIQTLTVASPAGVNSLYLENVDDVFLQNVQTLDTLYLTSRTGTLSANRVGSNHITFNANEINFTGGAGTIVGHDIFMQPVLQNQNITVAGTTDSDSGSFDLTTTDLAALADGFSTITIGRVNGTGQIYIPYNQFVWKDPVIFNVPDAGILTADVSNYVSEPYADDPQSYDILTSNITNDEIKSFTFSADSPATFWLNGNIKTAGGDIFIDDNITVILRSGNVDNVNKVTDSVIAVDTDGGDITFGSMIGHTTYLMLLAGITETMVDGGTINGAVEVYGLRLSGSGGELGVIITSVDNVYSQDKWPAVYTIVTLPAPHYGDFTFNGLPVRGLAIDRDPQNAFLMGMVTFARESGDLFSIENYALPEGYSDEGNDEEDDEEEASDTTPSEAGFGLTGSKADDGYADRNRDMDRKEEHKPSDTTQGEAGFGQTESKAADEHAGHDQDMDKKEEHQPSDTTSGEAGASRIRHKEADGNADHDRDMGKKEEHKPSDTTKAGTGIGLKGSKLPQLSSDRDDKEKEEKVQVEEKEKASDATPSEAGFGLTGSGDEQK